MGWKLSATHPPHYQRREIRGRRDSVELSWIFRHHLGALKKQLAHCQNERASWLLPDWRSSIRPDSRGCHGWYPLCPTICDCYRCQAALESAVCDKGMKAFAKPVVPNHLHKQNDTDTDFFTSPFPSLPNYAPVLAFSHLLHLSLPLFPIHYTHSARFPGPRLGTTALTTHAPRTNLSTRTEAGSKSKVKKFTDPIPFHPPNTKSPSI